MDYSLIYIIITIVVPGMLKLIHWCKQRKKESKQRKKERLKDIIVNGIQNTTYSELYEHLYRYHREDIERTKNKYHMVDYKYFKRTLESPSFNKIKFSSNESDYKYPLLFKQNWLKSNNDKLQIKLKPLVDEYGIEKYTLIRTSKSFLKKFGIADYIDFLKDDCKKRVWPQLTFDLFALEDNHTIEFSCCKGNYIYFVQMYEPIQKEFYYNHVYKKDNFVLRPVVSFDELENYSVRPAKIGINVFVIMKRKDGGYSTFIHKRRNDQVEYPGFYHVVPAGTFQPVSEHDIKKQYSFGFTIFREILEELFNLEKADKEYKETYPMKIFSLPIERHDLPIIYPGKELLGESLDLSKTVTANYELIPTGFLVDISSFKPEVTFLLYIKNDRIHDILSKYIEGNWEGDIGQYDMTGNAFCGNFFDFLNEHLKTDKFLPAGAVAISEGIRWYMTHLIE